MSYIAGSLLFIVGFAMIFFARPKKQEDSLGHPN
jgi:hypothetical protein